jgi:hypothetical protein
LVGRTEMCRLIAREDLPLCFAEFDAFHEYITRAHNPRFVKSYRQTIARDLIKHYNSRMERLIETLKSSVSSVALTSDIWSGKAKEDYISVVAHYVNSNWSLEKRLHGLRPIESTHTGSNITEHISMVVDDYGIANIFFAITLDNASSNKIVMSLLEPMFTGYLDFGCNDLLDLDDGDALSSIFLHQRCACHIINLIVKSGLKRLKLYLNDFRTDITFLNASNQRIVAYKMVCLSQGVCPRKFGVDMDVRWNSTYMMLKDIVPYRSTFSIFIQCNHPISSDGSPLLIDNHCYIADKLLAFLELFYDSTVALFWSLLPYISINVASYTKNW